MFGSLDISTSALVAQRTRMDAIAANIANAQTTEGPDLAYQRRVPVFAVGASPTALDRPGVHVSEILVDPRPGDLSYQPGHPHAIKEGPNAGMVRMPNVSQLVEMVNGMHAVRAYEANITMLNATKNLASSTLRLLG